MCALTQASTIVTDGLVSYWTLDRGHTDKKKIKDVWADNDATIHGNPSFVNGHFQDALEFNGKDDYISLSNLPNFRFQLRASTFEAWIKVRKNDKGGYLFFIQEDCTLWYISISRVLNNEAEDAIGYGIRFGEKGNEDGCIGTQSGLFSPTLFDRKWHHIVYTNQISPLNPHAFDDTLHSRIFIDGSLILDEKRFSADGSIFNPFKSDISLGAQINGESKDFFEGDIDEVRIYDRALSEKEVTQNYESDRGLVVKPMDKLSTVWGSLKMNN
ncbi:LamG domain-containing protein [Candidatus Poribacteria bacterium]|nr:LamG domain-containing protein [Candidatus Poribacteria bacterium]